MLDVYFFPFFFLLFKPASFEAPQQQTQLLSIRLTRYCWYCSRFYYHRLPKIFALFSDTSLYCCEILAGPGVRLNFLRPLLRITSPLRLRRLLYHSTSPLAPGGNTWNRVPVEKAAEIFSLVATLGRACPAGVGAGPRSLRRRGRLGAGTALQSAPADGRAGTRNWLSPQPIAAAGSWPAPPIGGLAPPSRHCNWLRRQAASGVGPGGRVWGAAANGEGAGGRGSLSAARLPQWASVPGGAAPANGEAGGAGGTSRTVELPERRGGGGIKPAGDAGGASRSPAPTRVAPKGTVAVLRRRRPGTCGGRPALHTGGIGEAGTGWWLRRGPRAPTETELAGGGGGGGVRRERPPARTALFTAGREEGRAAGGGGGGGGGGGTRGGVGGAGVHSAPPGRLPTGPGLQASFSGELEPPTAARALPLPPLPLRPRPCSAAGGGVPARPSPPAALGGPPPFTGAPRGGRGALTAPAGRAESSSSQRRAPPARTRPTGSGRPLAAAGPGSRRPPRQPPPAGGMAGAGRASGRPGMAGRSGEGGREPGFVPGPAPPPPPPAGGARGVLRGRGGSCGGETGGSGGWRRDGAGWLCRPPPGRPRSLARRWNLV